MKKLFYFALFFSLLVMGFASASININPNSVELGKEVVITIDMNSYGNYVYFYDDAENMISSYSLGCADNLCSKKTTFQYLIDDFDLGNYKIAVYSHDDNKWLFSNFEVVEYRCSDRTLVGECSSTKPKYCGEGEILVDDCSKCGCLDGYNCQEDETCTFTPFCGDDNCDTIESCNICPDDCGRCEYSVGPNKKNEELYSDKEVFLVSDSDWKEVLPFVSATVWTERDEIRKYPFLVYHEEFTSCSLSGNKCYKYDIDSSIYFMQQYNPDKLTIIGETPQEIDDLLIYENDGSDLSGPELSLDHIQRISNDDYLTYWETFDKVVYVEDDYELALLASTYASLINAPLIIEGNIHDSLGIFNGRNVICIGEVLPSGKACGEKYNLEELRDKYKTETNTNKVILINPTDWGTGISSYFNFNPDKTSGNNKHLYTKTSLISPILASSKHELILSTNETDYLKIDKFIAPGISDMDYLTIMAASNVIPHTKFRQRMAHAFDWALDSSHYADINGDYIPDVAVGRIAGLTSSDVSSYVARAIFYDTFPRTENTKFMASSFLGSLAAIAIERSFAFSLAGYNSESKTTILPANWDWNFFTSEDWKNQDLIFYLDHGSTDWSGIYSSKVPLLDNSLVFSVACDTAATYRPNSFWAIAIRKGAIGYYGATSITGLNNNYIDILNEIYSFRTTTMGGAFKEKWSTFIMHGMTTLIGDPTLDINPPHHIGLQPRSNICNPEKELCLTNGQCCDDLRCELFTCKGCQEAANICLFNTDCCSGLQCSWATCSDCNNNNEGCLVKNDCCESTAGCYMFECGLREIDESCLLNTDCGIDAFGCHMFECGLRGIGESCLFNDDCERNLDCAGWACTDGENGQSCSSAEDCSSDFCYWGTCMDRFPNGNGCLLDNDCASDRCSWFVCRSTGYVDPLNDCGGADSNCGTKPNCLDCNAVNPPVEPDCKAGDKLWHKYYHCDGAECAKDIWRSETETCTWDCKGSACTNGNNGESCSDDGDCKSDFCYWGTCKACYTPGIKVGDLTFKSPDHCCSGWEQKTKSVCRLWGGAGCKWYSHTKIVNDYKACR